MLRAPSLAGNDEDYSTRDHLLLWLFLLHVLLLTLSFSTVPTLVPV